MKGKSGLGVHPPPALGLSFPAWPLSWQGASGPPSNLVSVPATHTEPSHGRLRWSCVTAKPDSTGLPAQPSMLAPCRSYTCRPGTLRLGPLFTIPDTTPVPLPLPTLGLRGDPTTPTLPLSTFCQRYLFQVTLTLHLQTLAQSQLPEWQFHSLFPTAKHCSPSHQLMPLCPVPAQRPSS